MFFDFPFACLLTASPDLLRDLETWEHEEGDEGVVSAVRETRADLMKLVGKMDGLESGWDRIAERSRMSSLIPLPLPDHSRAVCNFSAIGFEAEFVKTAIDRSR